MSTLGSNVGFVQELYAEYQKDPTSVSEAWREFFADYHADAGGAPPAASATSEPALAKPAPAATAFDPATAVPLLGVTARIAENMTASLAVPTATSARTIAVKLLTENRRIINLHQDAVVAPRVSFTYLVAWAVVRALDRHPELNACYIERDGQPHRQPRSRVNLGLAVDVERHGERLLLVPNIKDAGALTFPAFVAAYEDIIGRARANKLAVADLEGTTVTLTNPGTIGTTLSIPRLMPGQGAIIGVGRISLPAEYQGVAEEVVFELGLSKVMTVTSTYDHRIIQGATSGEFLGSLEALLLGDDELYERIFRDLGVPHEPLHWSTDQGTGRAGADGNTTAIRKQASVLQLVRAHRVRGHLIADTNPLQRRSTLPAPELEMATYGLSVWDLDRRFYVNGLAESHEVKSLRQIIEVLRTTYCGHISAEFMHIPEPAPRDFLIERMERAQNNAPLDRDLQKRILYKLNAAEAFERFLHTTYVGHKRFSLEGAETLIPMLDTLLNEAGESEINHVVMGMSHRGRLNVLANTLGKSYSAIFREFEGDVDPESWQGSGDVKYHLGAKGMHTTPAGKHVELFLASNPSHLESVDPVVEGMARALQDKLQDHERKHVLPVLIHGDAAFAGQGVVTETLNLSSLKGYRTGGTIHIVVNNQIGFTTGSEDARSSIYATDVAKSVRAPIFHVNGDYPEDAIRALRLAFAFRQQFARDAVVDLVCYRRYGHNEADDPSYTHPIMVAAIAKKRSVRKLYTEQLLRRGDLDQENAEQSLGEFQSMLQAAHDEVRKTAHAPVTSGANGAVDSEDVVQPSSVRTAADRAVLEQVLIRLQTLPQGFALHPKLESQFARRRQRFNEGTVDWSLAETLAIGSLLLEGVPVRLSGQDSSRGTFSQRHARLYDQNTGAAYTPLRRLHAEQAPFWVYDSSLSELAVLGFEYGFSVNHAATLCLWEAQFGDFANGAQIVIDQFIAVAEEKWGQRSGLTLLLPHGYEGQGPEHSSARIERFLQLCARGNWRVCYPSTPASYFHLLRRQARYESKKPLVVFTPKSLLRLPACVSTADDLTQGTFREVIDDDVTEPVERVVLTSGKLFYDLDKHRRDRATMHVAVVRLEQYYPFARNELRHLLQHKYATVHDIVWAQEEPANAGAWEFVRARLPECLAASQRLRYVGRPSSASPATGSYKRHEMEQAALVDGAFEA